MEVAETVNGCRLTDGGSGVAPRRWYDRGDQPNGDVLLSETDAKPWSPSLTFQNQSSLMIDDDDWTQRRPESVWLDYLHAWNPLAAGIYYNGCFQASDSL